MVVVITGASSGIGRALAETLSRHGAKLALAARRIDRLEALNQALGGQHLCVQTDVSEPAQCEQLIGRTIDSFGRLDTLVCNAGYGLPRTVAKTTAEQMRQIFQTNVFGTTDCIRAAVPRMLAQQPRDGLRGQIMIVSSAAARRGLPYYGPYSATKAAQLALAEALRVELKAKAIAVTSVQPILTETEFPEAARRAAGIDLPAGGPREFQQSAATVAQKMLRAIRRPVPEVWPFAPTRWLLALGMLMPWVTDHFMAMRLKAYQR